VLLLFAAGPTAFCRENIQQMILGNMNIMDPAGW
jgi:hypothetical protein